MNHIPRKRTRWRHGRTRFEHPPMEDLIGAADGIFPMKVLLDEALDLMVRACGPIPMVDFARAKARFMEENSLDDLLKMPSPVTPQRPGARRSEGTATEGGCQTKNWLDPCGSSSQLMPL